MMIAALEDYVKVEIKGKVRVGCKAFPAWCPSCRKDVEGLKPQDGYVCPDCDSPVEPKRGEKERMVSLPYFLLPPEIEGAYPQRPRSLRVVPAYDTVERTVPNSFTKMVSEGKIFCTGDGVTARRYDKAKRAQVEIPCSEDCQYRKDGSCKPSATFYFFLPDVDVFSAYRLATKSAQSIANIVSRLNQLRRPDGTIARTVCELRIEEKKRKSTSTIYRVLQLSLPALSLAEAQAVQGRPFLQIGMGQPPLEPEREPIDREMPAGTPQKAQEPLNDADQGDRAMKGRAAVKEKIRCIIDHPRAGEALEVYACEECGVRSYHDLTVDHLLELWRGIYPGSPVVGAVQKKIRELRDL